MAARDPRGGGREHAQALDPLVTGAGDEALGADYLDLERAFGQG
jgi:hypothetical protein